MAHNGPSNVLGGALRPCCFEPVTGFYRDGFCRTGPGDYGLHTVCIEATEEFLAFSRDQGNDLSTPAPQYEFPGLRPGDRWCLCVTRWKDALDAGMAPRVLLSASHISALEFVSLEDLQAHAVPEESVQAIAGDGPAILSVTDDVVFLEGPAPSGPDRNPKMRRHR